MWDRFTKIKSAWSRRGAVYYSTILQTWSMAVVPRQEESNVLTIMQVVISTYATQSNVGKSIYDGRYLFIIRSKMPSKEQIILWQELTADRYGGRGAQYGTF